VTFSGSTVVSAGSVREAIAKAEAQGARDIISVERA
jgi:hypothetical protein